MALTKWQLNLQLFADGGDGGAGDGAAEVPGAATPDAGENRLRELGVPESVLAKRAKRAAKANAAPQQTQKAPPQAAAAPATAAPEGTAQKTDTPQRMTWDEIMADPEYNKQMQATMQARLKASKGAEQMVKSLEPAIELLCRKYGMDAKKLDAEALTKAISNDNDYYEDRALELGVPVETAKKIDQNERETARIKAEEAKTIEQQKIQAHFQKLQQQSEELKKTFKTFNLSEELKNPAFVRMTSPNVGISVEDAYYAIHRKEIQQASMQVAAKKTAQQMANSIRAGQSRPVENGTSNQAPSVTSFDYAHASRQQREALKKQIREAAARGQKIYPGQH